MEIYTSYFAKLSKLPATIEPIAICGKSPAWYTGHQFKMLAPKYKFFMEWKENKDNDFYVAHFNAEVLATLDPAKIVEYLAAKRPRGKEGIALICYEKPGDFCHRHLVASWLTAAGYNVKEWEG